MGHSSRRLGAVAAAAVLLLTACSGSGDSSNIGSGNVGSGPSGGGGGGTTSAGPTPYLPVPEGVTLTDPGSELGVGESAVVAWRPKAGEVGVLRLTVRQLHHADITDL